MSALGRCPAHPGASVEFRFAWDVASCVACGRRIGAHHAPSATARRRALRNERERSARTEAARLLAASEGATANDVHHADGTVAL